MLVDAAYLPADYRVSVSNLPPRGLAAVSQNHNLPPFFMYRRATCLVPGD